VERGVEVVVGRTQAHERPSTVAAFNDAEALEHPLRILREGERVRGLEDHRAGHASPPSSRRSSGSQSSTMHRRRSVTGDGRMSPHSI
jgi:hypothetical protein